MVEPCESNGALGEALNRLLGETFGTSGSGRINIKALHQLLSSLIDLHVRYEGEKQQNKLILESVLSQTAATAPEVVVCVNHISQGDIITELSRDSLSTSEKETSKSADKTDEDCSSAKDKEPSSIEQLSGSLGRKEEAVSNAIQTVKENGNGNTLDKKPSSMDMGRSVGRKEDDVLNAIQAVAESEKDKPLDMEPYSRGDEQEQQDDRQQKEGLNSTTHQRSSDFLVKSTSASEKFSDLHSQELSPASHTPSNTTKSSRASIGKKLTSPSFVADKISAKDNATQTAFEFEAILEGCRSHLEAVKEEVLSLKTRCQSQHEDTLKLAGGLDSVVYRVGTQESKVEKFDTDIHCLGMLVSDYEVNFQSIAKHLERHDVKVQEFERTFQRIDKEWDALRADIRSINEQVNYLSTVKADKVDVQTELNRRSLVTDMQQHVPYPVFNDTARDLTRTVTQLREELHELDQNLKTVQYELVKGLGAKASAQDVTQIRKQLVGALSRWQKAEKDQPAPAVIMGDTTSSAVTAISGTGTGSDVSKCLTCGIQTTLEGSHTVVLTKFTPVNKTKHGARNAGGIHTKCIPPEKVFRTGSLGVVKKVTLDEKRTEQQWKF